MPFRRIRSHVSENNLSEIKSVENELSSSVNICTMVFIYGREVTSRIPGHANVITPVGVNMSQISDVVDPSQI